MSAGIDYADMEPNRFKRERYSNIEPLLKCPSLAWTSRTYERSPSITIRRKPEAAKLKVGDQMGGQRRLNTKKP